MTEEFTRRRLLRTGVAATAGLGVIGTGAAEDGGAAPEVTGKIPCRDLTGADLPTTVSATEPAPEQATGVRPGSQMFMEFPDGTVAGCTANFIWRDPGETTGPGDAEESTNAADIGIESSENGSTGEDTYYIGAAGHCFLPEGFNASANAQRDGEADDAVFDVSQVNVSVCKDCVVGGATGLNGFGGEAYELGEVAYARQNLPDGTQVGHDFGIVEIPKELYNAVDPLLPQFGGPTGVEDGAVPQGGTVCQYGAGVANGEAFPTMASRGVSEGDLGTSESWYAGIRASPGDSGSPLEEYAPPEGTDATGILTHLTTIGTAGTTATRCVQLPKEDGLDLDLELVLEGEEIA